MAEFFGPRGDGVGGQFNIAFPVKSRSSSHGGDWTFELSCQLRPTKTTSIMNHGKQAVSKVLNVYIPLQKKLLYQDKLPSGWSEDDLHLAMLVNLLQAFERRQVNAG